MASTPYLGPLGIACLAVFPCVCTAADPGFIEDSHLTLLSRFNVLNTQILGDGHHQRAHNRRDPRDVALGERLSFASGYTQGTLGVGLDAFAYGAFKLDGGTGHAGYGNVQVNDQGQPKRTFGRAGGLIKLRYGQTQLRYGQMEITNPVFATADARLLPSTATGFHLTNQDVRGLLLEGGHFTAGTEPASTSNRGGLWANYAYVQTPSVDFAGGRYAFNEHGAISAYTSQFQDLWRQYYIGSTYGWVLSPRQKVDLELNLYQTHDQGQAKAGVIDTTAYSSLLAYTLANHKLTVAFEHINGDTPFDYIGFGNNGSGAFGNSIYLSNAIMASDFNGPNEKSWQARYDLDLAPYGVPGLSLMGRYVYGYDISSSPNAHYGAWANADGASHKELDIEARYVVQSGPVKGMRVRLRQGVHRAEGGQPDGDITMRIVVVEWPLQLF
ncbi:MAG: OprD family outer membrane porin [Pseudomonas sp.]|nr:OprD family outer membrane porin [Pseudomonas sp.]